MQIVQLLPTISFGDAVGNDVRAIENFLRERGIASKIYAENIDSRLPKGTALSVSELPYLTQDDVILYHASTGTNLNYELPNLGGRKVMIYHNITPPHFFVPYSDAAMRLTKSGIEGIRYLSDKIDYCIADSEFNKQDLLKMGYRCPIDVCPILIPFEDYKKEPDKKVLDVCRADGYTNLLFVGRIAPNKKQEDCIAAFYYYHKYYNQKSRLILGGSWDGMDRYYQRLCNYAERLGISEDVVFPGHTKFSDILAYYQAADVFLCMSEHEGFCVPLVEAMYFHVPIVAYSSTAIPDTLGHGGILLSEKSPALVAAVINRVMNDPELRTHLQKEQDKQLHRYSYESVKTMFLNCLEKFLKGESR